MCKQKSFWKHNLEMIFFCTCQFLTTTWFRCSPKVYIYTFHFFVFCFGSMLCLVACMNRCLKHSRKIHPQPLSVLPKCYDRNSFWFLWMHSHKHSSTWVSVVFAILTILLLFIHLLLFGHSFFWNNSLIQHWQLLEKWSNDAKTFQSACVDCCMTCVSRHS